MSQVSAAPTPPAPDTTVNVAEISKTTLDVLYLLATATGPVSAAGQQPAFGLTLATLRKRGLAELAAGDGTVKMYVISGPGRLLAAVLWPEVEVPAPAPKPRRTRKPAAKDAS